MPYLYDVGERWATDHMSVAQEHFASNFVHSRLLALARGWDRGLGPRALLACAAGELHTLALIAFGIALHAQGWKITYLGAATPVAMVDAVATQLRPDLIVVTSSVTGGLTALPTCSRLAAGRRLAADIDQVPREREAVPVGMKWLAPSHSNAATRSRS